MTRTHTLTLASALMVAALAVAVPMQAQAGGNPSDGMRHRGPKMAGRSNTPSVDERVQRMSGNLNLTPEQAARVKALLTVEQRAADSTHGVRAVQWDAERKGMDARRADHEKALSALLTPEQRTKHEALMKEHRGRGMMRGPGHDGPGGGRGMHRGPGSDAGSTR